MITITTTLISSVIDHDCGYILSNHDYNHEYDVYQTNVNVIGHLYSFGHIYSIIPI